MFDRLSDGFNNVFRKLSGQGSISEKNITDAMAEVRTALLEADVHYDVVKAFCDEVVADVLGREVTKSLKPGQEMIGIVHRRLVALLGGDPDADPQEALKTLGTDRGIMKVSPPPTVVMMCGLQGSGKTTTCGKLAAMLKKQGRKTMVCAADLQRPAAIEQLHTVVEHVNKQFTQGPTVLFHGEPDKAAEYGKAVNVAVKVCQRALDEARQQGVDVLILDTAGRLHVNDELMTELHLVNRAMMPHHIFLVVDAMTGQDAVNSAKAFHERLTVDGVILTKFDSDTRGGAALSVKQVTGAPIRYIGVGEKLDQIEPFHPERMAGRILGMGDVVSLVEKAQQEVSEEDAAKLSEKMARGEMTMDDFLSQLRTLRRMGSMKQLLGLLPGVGSMLKDADVDEGQLKRIEAMIQSMTAEERAHPKIIHAPRRRRIAEGSGSEQPAVGQLIKQFDAINKMAKSMAGAGGAGRIAAARQMASAGGMPGMGLPMMKTKGSTKQAKRGVKQRKKRKH
ncbi:MAG: signal recognition particle protein [Phycisphaeraceae bacterium]|nr:MAG: signal recognition particle protein [Phycisphaeraceae bacterium]